MTAMLHLHYLFLECLDTVEISLPVINSDDEDDDRSGVMRGDQRRKEERRGDERCQGDRMKGDYIRGDGRREEERGEVMEEERKLTRSNDLLI